MNQRHISQIKKIYNLRLKKTWDWSPWGQTRIFLASVKFHKFEIHLKVLKNTSLFDWIALLCEIERNRSTVKLHGWINLLSPTSFAAWAVAQWLASWAPNGNECEYTWPGSLGGPSYANIKITVCKKGKSPALCTLHCIIHCRTGS